MAIGSAHQPAARKRGFGLVDGLLALGLAAITVTVALTMFGTSAENNRADDMVTELTTLQKSLVQAYGASNLSAGGVVPTAATVSAQGFIDAKYLVGGTPATSLNNPWGNPITLGQGGGGSGAGYTVDMGKMPTDACIKVLSTVAQDGDLTGLTYTGSSGNSLAGTPLSLTPDQINTACTSLAGSAGPQLEFMNILAGNTSPSSGPVTLTPTNVSSTNFGTVVNGHDASITDVGSGTTPAMTVTQNGSQITATLTTTGLSGQEGTDALISESRSANVTETITPLNGQDIATVTLPTQLDGSVSGIDAAASTTLTLTDAQGSVIAQYTGSVSGSGTLSWQDTTSSAGFSGPTPLPSSGTPVSGTVSLQSCPCQTVTVSVRNSISVVGFPLGGSSASLGAASVTFGTVPPTN